MNSPRTNTGLEIVVVGMAGRFPGASSVRELWANLRDGVESITHFTRTELLAASVDPALLDDPDCYDKGFLHCDLLIIGAGPAGLAAALTAARSGAQVILAEEDFVFIFFDHDSSDFSS